MSFDKILVPLDGSALAEAALPKAVALAGDRGRITLLRAAEAPLLLVGDPTQAQVDVVQEAEEYLAAVASRLRVDGFTRLDTSVWYGPPAPAIVESARVEHADIIVMSTHGRGGLGRLILGSVAESVLRGVTTPILLIRAAEAPVETPRAERPAPIGEAVGS